MSWRLANGPEVAATFERAKRQHRDLYALTLMREAMSQANAEANLRKSAGATPD